MREVIYYLISPRRELVAKALERGASDLGEFILPVLWTAEKADRGEMGDAEIELLVKVLYSCAICNLQSAVSESELIFGEASATSAFFDRHWTIQKIPYDMTVDMALNDAHVTGVINRAPPTGNKTVDEYLARYESLRAREVPK